MSLTAGDRLGPYEILAPLAAGAMGEVYRARDTKLGREVAVKVLPALFAADPDRLARFEREARTLASLNHPNIAQVHGVMENPAALVMELVEGQTLEELIQRSQAPLARDGGSSVSESRQSGGGGPHGIPLDEALPAARQIADALEAAHENGIIHRDLKPANIKQRPDGTIKVLDFGLAKALDPAGPSGQSPTQSPTLTAHTQLGTIIGTAAYMAPEQARGRTVDRRADIWAFGCVLYEMLSGRRAFAGDDLTDTLTSVLRDTPDWTALPAETPAGLRALLARCLEKDPRQRLRDIGEARVLLGDDRLLAPEPSAVSPTASRASWRRTALWTTAAALLVALAAIAGYVARPAPPEPQVRKSRISLRLDGSALASPVISPDGRHVVFAARSRLWVQALDAWEPRELAGTEGGTRPFWSPDSAWIVFFRSEQLLKVPVSGGPVLGVATLPAVQAPLNAASGVWRHDGTLLISLAADGTVYAVPSGGGELEVFFELADTIGTSLHHVDLLPDGALLATVGRPSGTDAIGVVANGAFTILLETSGRLRRPRYAPSGHIIYERSANAPSLWAVTFTAGGLSVTGEPFVIGRGSDPSVARDGTLVYRGEGEELTRQLAWFTMDGVAGAVIAAPQEWTEGVALSPDGRRLLAAAADGIWVYDVAGGGRGRLTTGRSDITPQWVGSGGDVVFVRTSDGQPDLMLKRAGAAGAERVLAKNARFPSVTADGRRIVFNQRVAGEFRWQVAWIDLDAPSDIHRLGDPHMGARFPAVSPDGQLVSYVSGEIGRDEVFVTRLPGGEGKLQASTDGGGWTRFSGAGAILYRAPGGDFMSVPLTSGRDLSIGPPQRLFEWGAGWAPFYELAADGRRGITAMAVERTSRATSLSVVQNWEREFARK